MEFLQKHFPHRENEFLYGEVNLDDTRTGSDERFVTYLTPGTMVRTKDKRNDPNQKEEVVYFNKVNELAEDIRNHYLSDYEMDTNKQYVLLVTRKEDGTEVVRVLDDVKYNTGVHPDVGMHF